MRYQRKRLEGGSPTYILVLSMVPCFFPLKHCRHSQPLLMIWDHILISSRHSPPICWFGALLLTPTPPLHPQHQLVWALQMQTHLNVSWSNMELERQTGDKNRSDNHSILDCQRAFPGPLNPSRGKEPLKNQDSYGLWSREDSGAHFACSFERVMGPPCLDRVPRKNLFEKSDLMPRIWKQPKQLVSVIFQAAPS